jgi:D-psicose/D-tagatose/L-ribulose 3-epimerase
MIFGVHAYLFTDRWTDERLDILDTAATLGAGAVELPVGDDIHFTPILTKRRAEQLGLRTYVGPGGIWPLECDLSSDDPEERASGLAWHKRQVDLAHDMGAIAYAGALYGHPGVVKRRVPPPDEYERTAEGLHKLAEHGSQRGVAIVLEPMSHRTTQSTLRTDNADDRDGSACQPPRPFDTYYMVTEIRDHGRAATVSGRLWGVPPARTIIAPGGGLVPWEIVFKTLGNIEFDGYLVLRPQLVSRGFCSQTRHVLQSVPGRCRICEGFRFLKAGLQAAAIG